MSRSRRAAAERFRTASIASTRSSGGGVGMAPWVPVMAAHSPFLVISPPAMLARLFPPRWRGALIVLLAVTAALQLAWVVYAARPPLSDHDPAFYLHAATELASGHGYRFFDGQATAYYPVGYPAVLSVVIFLVRHTPLPDNLPRAAGGLNVVLGLANVLLVFHL